MRRRIVILPLLVLALVGLAAASSGCGDEATAEAKEGEPLELGDLAYNIQITRELNRFSTEDAAYVAQPRPILISPGPSGIELSFDRPGAVVLVGRT